MGDLRAFFMPKVASGGAAAASPGAGLAMAAAKRRRVDGPTVEIDLEADSPTPRAQLPADPRKIITWNANGFMARVTAARDLAEFQALVRAHDPDVICLQEARVKAHCADPKAKVSSKDVRDRSRPLASEWQGPLRAALESQPLSEYAVHWSLANGRAAGTAMLIHRRLGASKDAVVCCPAGARATFRGSGGGADLKGGGHNEEGRFQYACFAGYDLLNTYVPNNGWTEDRHLARRQWDEELHRFLTERRGATQKPLIWCGDLNVAHRPEDSTDEEVFRGEWDRDSKRFASKEAYQKATPEDDRGIPGFSNNERRRFDAALEAGGLFDAWRRLHPVDPQAPPDPGDPAFTWRGTPAVQANFRARYEGMGQRLDYFLLSEALAPRLLRCEILGRGAERAGFLGSDHCPVLLELSAEASGGETA